MAKNNHLFFNLSKHYKHKNNNFLHKQFQKNKHHHLAKELVVELIVVKNLKV